MNWRDKTNWHCNQRLNPYGEFYNDGISVNPYEVMFVKVNLELQAHCSIPTPKRAMLISPNTNPAWWPR